MLLGRRAGLDWMGIVAGTSTMRPTRAALRTLRAVPPNPTPDDAFVPHIPHQAFKTGLPFGHFHVVVNPTLAKSYVVHVTRLKYVTLAVLGVGVALALSSHVVAGGLLVLAGIAANRLVKRQAGPILLHLATRNEAIYEEATGHGVMEVRRV